MTFLTRPDVRGNFGVVSSTHWIASSAGMAMLEIGGNAFDAAVAAGLVLQVVEPHLNGPGGDLPAIFVTPDTTPRVLCAQGTAPAAATIASYRAAGLQSVPGSGFPATVVPGAFDGWMLLLRDFGTLALDTVMAPAIHYASKGHPALPRLAATIGELSDFFFAEWPSSAKVWMPGGTAPGANELFRNPELAATWERILQETKGVRGREARIDAARDRFYRGFVAAAIDKFLRSAVMDASGQKNSGYLTADDMAAWQASYEPSLSAKHGGWTIHKTGPWGQGPVLLQSLAILHHTGIADVDLGSADFVHLSTEAMKIAYADRDVYYGDPAFSDVPIDRLLSPDYARARGKLVGSEASFEQRPGAIPGFEAQLMRALSLFQTSGGDAAGVGAGEPTFGDVAASKSQPAMTGLGQVEGDTVHVDVADRWGNVVSATPSGGWLQSSPVVPGLGFPMNSRAQMFWLEDGLPSSLRPGARPRTTLSPSLAMHEDGRILSVGTPGGDQQDQWQLIFFLHLLRQPESLQAVLDAPMFHSTHVQASFAPRTYSPAGLTVEPRLGEGVIKELKARGHNVTVAPDWSVGRLTCALRQLDGQLVAAASPRMMQAYAVGR